MPEKLRSAYVPHSRVQSTNNEPTRTKTSMQAECDINNIMEKFKKTGMVNHFTSRRAEYLDMPMAEDFHEAINTVLHARTMFDELPSELRNRFHNDPELFLEFVDNEANRPEMVQMGLLEDDKPLTPRKDDGVVEPAPAEPASTPSPEEAPGP